MRCQCPPRFVVWVLVLFSCARVARGEEGSSGDLKLWYRQPAAEWGQALPIGNGRLGGMVFGGLATERIQLNEDTVWSGEKGDQMNPEAARSLPEVRRLLLAGRIADAEALAERAIIAIPSQLPPYQPLGDLWLRFEGQDSATEYRRELDLHSAIARVSYRAGDARYTREIFSSAADQVLVIRLTCDRPGGLSFAATLTREADSVTRALDKGRVELTGEALPHGERYKENRKTGVKFAGVLQMAPEGGTMEAHGSEVKVRGANAVTLLLAAATNFKNPDPARKCDQYLAAAARKPYAALRAAHIADYQKLFQRVDIQLGAPAAIEQATDERLQAIQAGGTDPALEALYFQYGRYLQISCSRPGTMAANLRGIWNPDLSPPWDCKYMLNINLDAAYWPTEVCNLPECDEPLFDLIDLVRVDGRKVARDLYGARGFVAHHGTDLWGHAVPLYGIKAGLWPMGGAWMSLHLWEHYDFTRERKFLAKRAYPVMKEAALFVLDTLVDDGNGQLVNGPSLSPENPYYLPDGSVHYLCMGPTADIEVTRALFSRVIQAAELLGVDGKLRRQLADARDRLPPLKIGKHGQLMEWQEDYEEPEPGHRHMSHLYAFYPGDGITLRGDPQLARAVEISAERRANAKDGSVRTGWCRAWEALIYARLEKGEQAHAHLASLLVSNTMPNLFALRPPFLIDGNFAGTAAIAEMLLQSHVGEISLLPALPKNWPSGAVRGLRARGAVEVGLNWAEGKATEATLETYVAGQRLIRAPRGQIIAEIQIKDRKVPFSTNLDGLAQLNMAAGKKYRIAFTNSP